MNEMIWPVILSGGSGTRLWPLSRTQAPKQLLALTEARTMLQATAARFAAPGYHPPLVVCGSDHADAIAGQLAGTGATLLVEPAARNTAAALALAALEVARRDPAGVMLAIPSDHVIADSQALRDAVARGLPVVADGWLATFGIVPDHAATGYGWIEIGAALADGVAAAVRFVEKPPRDAAEAMLAHGGFAWNGGLFLFRADVFLAALGDHAPDVLAAATAALAGATRGGDRIDPDGAAFAAAPAISIDYAVMEKAARVAVIPVSMGWSDIGAWDAVRAHGPADADGNVVRGPAVLDDTHGCLVRSEGPLIAMLGVSDLIVVATGDAVLVAHADAAQNVRRVVAALPDPALASRAVAVTGAGHVTRWLADGDGLTLELATLAPHAQLSVDAVATLLSGSAPPLVAGAAVPVHAVTAGAEGARILLQKAKLARA